MDKEEIRKIIKRNSSIDRDSFRNGINVIREFKESGGSVIKKFSREPQFKKAISIDDRDDLTCVRASYQQY